MLTFDRFVVWIVVGLIGGSLAGRLTAGNRAGYGLWRNIGLGMVGALIGGLLFRALRLFPELDKYSISLRDIVAAIVGSLLLILARWLWQRSKSP
jgi:uncharacterized membrane protein YeaQ/YmgE (transglycosylase-associated protein family)